MQQYVLQSIITVTQWWWTVCTTLRVFTTSGNAHEFNDFTKITLSLYFWGWQGSLPISVYLPSPNKQVGTPTPRFFWGGQTTKCVNPYLVPTWSSDSHPVYSKLEECLIRMLQLSESMIKYFTLKDWGASFRSWLSGLHVSLLSRAHNSNTEQIIQRGINFFRSSLTLII